MILKPVNTGKSIAAIATLALIASLGLAGCSATSSGENNAANAAKDNQTNQQLQDEYRLMFAQMMIPHHQQAVAMGTLAETRASSTAVKELAAKIAGEQAPEVSMMQGWIDGAGAAADGGMHMNHMTMDGMLTDAQMAELKSASGGAFDKLYLNYMIAHHEGAVKLAKLALKSKNTKLEKLAKSIVDSQTAQIEYMKSLLAK